MLKINKNNNHSTVCKFSLYQITPNILPTKMEIAPIIIIARDRLIPVEYKPNIDSIDANPIKKETKNPNEISAPMYVDELIAVFLIDMFSKIFRTGTARIRDIVISFIWPLFHKKKVV